MSREIVRRLERLLGPDGLREAGVVLDEAGEIVAMPPWLEALVTARSALPLHEVPPTVSQDLVRLFEIGAEVERGVAVLVRDTRTSRRPAGVRGADPTEGWSMMYTSAVADVVLDVWPNEGGTVDVAGQVMAHRELGKAYRTSLEGPITVAVAGDRLGRFRVRELPRGTYGFTIGDGEIEVRLTADLAGATT